MTKSTKVLCWAALIVALAFANIFAFIADDTARVLFVVLPLVAWMNISGRSSCRFLQRGADA